MPTFVRHESSDGSISYQVKIRLKGVPSQCATFKRLTDAKRWAQSTESAIREGRYFKTSEAKRHTLAEMVDRYIDEIIPTKPKNACNTQRNLKWWKQKIGSSTLADVSPALIAQCRDSLLSSNTSLQMLAARLVDLIDFMWPVSGTMPYAYNVPS